MTSFLFDTHAHVMDRRFSGDIEGVMERAQAAGVGAIAAVGYDAATNEGALELAARWPFAYATCGYHPHEAKDITPAMLVELESLIARPDVYAVGEIGMDDYRHHSPLEVQRRVLERQLEIASRHAKPVLVHSRECEGSIAEVLTPYAESSPLRTNRRPVGVMHCFGGTLEQALQYVDLGFLISLACVVTYPKNEEARRIARELPLDSLVIETDSPYLPPQQQRGKRNEPANVRAAAEAIAEVRGVDYATVAGATTANAERLFGIRVREAVRA